MSEKLFEIVSGPSKSNLFYAFENAYDDDIIVRTIFTVVYGFTASRNDPGRAAMRREITDLQIAGLTYEDGSGESFNLVGFCHDANFLARLGEKYSGYFEACYHTGKKTGHIVFIKR